MRRVLVVMLVGIMAVVRLLALDRPPPPDGYSWREVDDIKGAVLVPDGWHFAIDHAKGLLVLYVTEQEDVSAFVPAEKLLTGVTIDVFVGIKSSRAQIRDAIIAEAKKYSVQVVMGEFGPFKTLQIKYERAATPEHPAIQIVRLAVINPKTDTTYYTWFETPTQDWERTWPKANTVISHYAFNAKF